MNERRQAGKRRIQLFLNEIFGCQIITASWEERLVFWDRGEGGVTGIERQR